MNTEIGPKKSTLLGKMDKQTKNGTVGSLFMIDRSKIDTRARAHQE